MKKILAIITFLFFVPSFGLAAKYEVHFSPLNSEEIGKRQYEETTLENGLNIKIDAFVWQEVGTDFGKSGRENYVFRWTNGIVRYPATKTIVGYDLSFKNSSDQTIIIKWAHSSITIDQKSGTPFLAGMKYANAGDPSATPISIVPPQETIAARAYLPTVVLSGRDWSVEGIPVPKIGSINGFLTFCILDENNIEKYHTLYAWPIKAFEVDDKKKK